MKVLVWVQQAEPNARIRVSRAFEMLNVVRGTASGVFSRDASVFVASRVCIVCIS